ncbi:DUF4959 domain-containing protein [Pedobacter nyackensis]|uniref:DUF4959 domain-containing protein n=1 Tax=Pedobacter nyackensis TaxID=475255 RepID=UPI002930CC5E|nr:DUF4959 domain-containing protein [Pedobacter nyackensis]
MKNIKYYFILLFIGLITVGMLSCAKDDGEREPVSKDMTKPDVVTNLKVDNYKGGANITYDLPASENILYVLARYEIRNGVSRETKSSYYTDTITVEGFAKAQEYEVTLYTVSRANVMSDPVKVKVSPKKPVFREVRDGLALTADFGGINVKTVNSSKKEIGILLLTYDPSTKAMEIQDQYYTRDEQVDYSIRGFNADPRDFAVCVIDKYGNVSDTLQVKLSPLFEEMLKKSLFTENRLPLDTKLYTANNWPVSGVWDGVTDLSAPGWHTLPGESPPFTMTFNVGRSYQLSRFVLWERSGEYAYGHGNPKVFSLWGSNARNPADVQLPVSAPEGTVLGDWINLGNYNYPMPPSGLSPSSVNASDRAFVEAGVNFNVKPGTPPVHFLRVAVAQTWSGGTICHFMEISLYGSPQ